MNGSRWIAAIGILACLGACSLGRAQAQQVPQAATENGLVTLPSSHAVADTVDRFEAAVRTRGWVVFARLDHAAAAEAARLQLRPRTVVVFGNPKGGTPAMRTNPTLAIDLPLKALIWQDDNDKVWVTYNSAEFLREHVYGRHGIALAPETQQALERFLGDVTRAATE